MAWRWVTVAVGALLVSSCGSARSTVQLGPGPIRLAGGCGSTTLQRGRPPSWTTSALSAGGGQRPAVPFALSAQGTALAVVFGYPLRAGHPADSANKILWIMRRPRDGSGLVIHAQPLFARARRSPSPSRRTPHRARSTRPMSTCPRPVVGGCRWAGRITRTPSIFFTDLRGASPKPTDKVPGDQAAPDPVQLLLRFDVAREQQPAGDNRLGRIGRAHCCARPSSEPDVRL